MDINKKKIFIIVPHHTLSVIGGGQKSLIDLANILVLNNFNIEIIYSDKKEEELFFQKEDSIKIVNLHSKRSGDFSVELEKYIENNKPDLMIFFFINTLRRAIKKNLYPDIPKILMHHSRPDIYYRTSIWFKKSIVKKLAKFNNFYCHVLLESYKPYIDKLFKVPCCAIPNIVDSQTCHIDTDTEKKKIIYLSRIDSQKGHKFLIKSFSLIAKKYPEWTLHIYGEYQPEKIKKELENVIKKCKLENQVFLHGVTSEPIKKMLECDFCVFPSFYEGFGLGLAEALSVGLPSIGLKECSGVNELIIDGENGFLTDKKEKDFAQKMETLILDKDLRSKMSKNAVKSVEKYNSKNISEKWTNLINSVVINHGEKYMEPKISLITLCYNQLENATKPLLDSLYKYTNPELFELIIVDNASTDGTKEFLDEFKKTKNNVTVIHNDENYGYAKGNNIGLNVAKGDYIFLLNNDLLFTPNWLEKFVELLKNNQEIGLISCVTNHAGLEQQLVKNYKELSPKNYLDKVPQTKENTYEYINGERVVFFCIGFRRDAFEKIGYLDENFGLAWYEDDDYTIRTIMSGYKVAVAKNIFIYHNHSQTTSKLVKEGKAKKMFEKNKAYFDKKHYVYTILKEQAKANFENEFNVLEHKHKKYKKYFNVLLPIAIIEFFVIIFELILLIFK